jgi:hypothetical protein
MSRFVLSDSTHGRVLSIVGAFLALEMQVVCIIEVNFHELPNILTKFFFDFVDGHARRSFLFYTN